MIVNEISLVIQKIFSVKQPKDQRFPGNEIESMMRLIALMLTAFLFNY